MPRLKCDGFPNLKSIIQPGWLVGDYGGGTNPSEFSTVVVDIAPTNAKERGKIVRIGDAQNLKGVVKDKEFDFVIASHIAEHMHDPVSFCREMMRTSKAGYIETPSPLYESFFEWTEHKWLVDIRGDSLYFREKNYNNCPGHMLHDYFKGQQEGLRSKHDTSLRTRFLWDGDFKWIVDN